jgi:hypothetical protein
MIGVKYSARSVQLGDLLFLSALKCRVVKTEVEVLFICFFLLFAEKLVQERIFE